MNENLLILRFEENQNPFLPASHVVAGDPPKPGFRQLFLRGMKQLAGKFISGRADTRLVTAVAVGAVFTIAALTRSLGVFLAATARFDQTANCPLQTRAVAHSDSTLLSDLFFSVVWFARKLPARWLVNVSRSQLCN